MNLQHALQTAELNHRQGQLKLAQTQYQNLIEKYDSNDAIYGLATLYFQQKEYAQAITLFEEIQKREPFAADIALNYALCLNLAKQDKKALSIISEILPHIPNDTNLVIAFARLTFSLKNYQLTISILQLFPLPEKLSNAMIANSYMQLEQWEKAQPIWLALTKTKKEQSEYWHQLSICLAKLRKYPEAIHAFTAFIKLSQQSSSNYLNFADLYLMARDTTNAKKQLQIAISLNDQSLTRFELETRIYRLENNVEKAIEAADNALTINAESYLAWKTKSELAKQYSCCISALKHLQITQLSNNFQNQQNLFTLAKAYEATDNFSNAFECFIKANTMQEELLKLNNSSFITESHIRDNAVFSKVLAHQKRASKNIVNNSIKNIFIVGMPRSGTTLVDRLLSQHSKVESVGESEALAFSIEHHVKNNKENSNYDWQLFFEKNAAALNKKYHEYTSISADIIVDKMPHNFRYVGAIASIFSQAKIIQMRRSPQDLALSIFSHPFALEHNYAAKLPHIAHAIYQANKLMDFWAEQFPEQVINVNYEELTQTANQVAENLFDFCQLTWQQEYLNFYKNNVSSFTFSELQVRQAINTNKVNFSSHYQKQLQEFNDIYSNLLRTP